MSSSDSRKIDNAFADAEEELDKPQPDKAEVVQKAEGRGQRAEGTHT
ncbi:MAG: hypothetical protein PUP91_03460 [Rhizonema sp. PD37]|nr:hypothetical protein [Rhizonema sp. PD37]